jgi:membrane protease YdiL (CAAX protease family)
MNILQRCLTQYPLLTSTLMVILAVACAKAPLFMFEFMLEGFFSGSNTAWLGTVGRLLVSFVFIGLLVKLSWAKHAGLTQPFKNWGKHWFLVICPMLIIGLVNLSSVQWASLQFSLTGLLVLLSENIAVGLFEEVIMRGFAFYILYRAWAQQKYGLYQAAIVQAVIFGLLHLFNLGSAPRVDVIAQVIYATLLGIGFAGVVAYTRTLWTAVFAHTFINTIGSISNIFVPNYIQPPTSVGNYIVLTVVILLLVTLPGLWCLKQVNKNEYLGVAA